jgi:tripartite-type tricarboxylate transporter receptor subunit TctC
VLSNQVTMTFSDVISGLPMVRSGQLRPIAVTTAERSSVLPDVPAIAETVPGYSAGTWYGVFAPARTPQPIVDKLNAVLVQMTKDPAFQQKMPGAVMVGDTSAQFVAFMKEASARWGKMIRDAKITPQG